PALISQYLEGEISILVEGEQGIDSKIKKALIWCDPDFNLFDAHLEKDAIESILTSHGIECDVFACEQCTKEEFIKRYSSNEYDLIWLMCHGNFDFNIPSNSSLNVGSNEYVNLNQLINIIPVRDKKRMLILNACQSGCSSIRYNAMGFVGLGPGLTNKYQSVVGHLWPVDSFAAGVWAALFANELAGGNSWDLSLNKSIRIMSGGLEEIQKNMNDISHLSIANSLSRRNFEWNKMGYWSSPVIFR
ncbi:CHAT domain-containing protein, partial [Bacillus thuringiensis]|uniref:CHAT domain-containing protein n=2 Tax=Bacillaceae TaxID=186817 RepID=UPI002FFED59D